MSLTILAKHFLVVFIIALLLKANLFAQVIGFVAPDTVCTGEPINITNTSTGGSTWYWNFCTGNANQNPVGTNIGNPGSLLSVPTYITLVKQGTECFSFVSCQGVGVVRYFHGASFKNNPVSWTNLGTFGGTITFNQEGIQVKEEDGQWYAFVCSDTKLVRLNFGTSLWNNPSSTSLNFSGLNMLHGLVIIREGTTWIGLATCSTGNKMVRFNFGNSLANTPVITDFGNFGVLNSPGALCLAQENSTWYGLITNAGNTLARISFGASLLNMPTAFNLGNPGGFNSPVGITVLYECESAIGYWVNYLSPGQLGRLTFPSGLAGPVTGQVLGNIGNLDKPHGFSELFRQNDTLYTFITNRQTGTLTRLTFPPCNNASMPSSTLFNPQVFSYNTPGTYNVRLIMNEGLPTQATLCKNIVVLAAPCNATASFQAPDTVCVGEPISLVNLSTGGNSNYWNFCSGNTSSMPVGTNIGNPGNNLNNPVYLTLVKDGNDCFNFVTNQGSPTHITRIYHGNNFRNDPVSVATILQTGVLQQYTEAIQIRKDNGTWYGFVNNNTTIIRLNFGNSLWNTSPVVTDLGPFPNISVAHGLIIIKEGTTWLGFLVSDTQNKLFRLNFGSSLSNIPAQQDLGNIATFSHPCQIASIKENGICYLLIVNMDNQTLSRINFGNTYMNTPVGVNLGNCGGLVSPVGITLLNDCETTTGFYTVCKPTPLAAIGRLTFTGGVSGTVVAQSMGNLGNLYYPHSFSELFRQNDSLFAFVTNRNSSTLTRFSFPPCNNASIPSSTLFTPVPFTYNTPGTYSIRLVINEGSFNEASICQSVFVSPAPITNLGPDKSICPGVTTTLDAGVGFTSYLWSTGATTRMITTGIAGSYWVRVSNYGCFDYDTVLISFYPVAPINLGPDLTICEGQSATFNAGTCIGCTYQWSNISSGQPNIGTGPTYSTGIQGIYSVKVINENGCISRDTVQLFTSPTPLVTNWPLESSVCSGSLFTLNLTSNISGSSFSWSAMASSPLVSGWSSGSGYVISQYLQNTSSFNQTVTYNITPLSGNCAGSSVNYVVTIKPTPLITVNPVTQSVCSGSNVIFNLASSVSGTSFSYIASGSAASVSGFSSGFGSSVIQTLFNSGIIIENVIYEIASIAQGCQGNLLTYNVPVIPMPDLTVDPLSANICSGNSTIFQLSSSAPMVAFSWTSSLISGNITGFSPGAASVIAQTLTNLDVVPGIVGYSVIASIGTCMSQPVNVQAIVNPAPTITNSVNMYEICSGTYTAINLISSVPGTQFSWTASASSPDLSGYGPGSGASISQQLFNNGYTSQTVTYTSIPYSLGCNGTPGIFTVTVHPIPAVAFSPPETSVCSGTLFNVQLTSNVQSVNYTWVANGSSIFVSNYYPGTGPVIQQAPQNSGASIETVSYIVTPQSNGCSGIAMPYNATVYPIPTVMIGPHPIEICANEYFIVDFSSSTFGTTFNWTASASAPQLSGFSGGNGSNITHLLLNSGILPGDVTYQIVAQANGCVGTITPLNVTVKPKPDITVMPPDQSVCYGQLAQIQMSSSFQGATFNWTATCTSNAVSGYFPGSGNMISQSLYNSGASPETVTYSLSSAWDGCDSPLSEALVLTYPVPGVIFSPPVSSICSGESTNILLQPQVAGTIFQWVAAGSPFVTGYSGGTGSAIVQQLANTSNASGMVSYMVTPSVVNCYGIEISTTVTVFPKPIVSFPVCHDTLTTVSAKPILLRSGFPIGGIYSGPGISPGSGVFNPSVAGPGNFSINYTYTNYYGCFSGKTSNIHVLPAPSFSCGENLIDLRDGHNYGTFLLPNGKCWMQENLSFGTSISYLLPQTDNCIPEGYLSAPFLAPSFYQWDEMMEYAPIEGSKGICPPGWHVPSSAEWYDLMTFFNDASQAGGPLKDTLLQHGFHSLQKGLMYLNNTFTFTSGAYAGSMYWTSTMEGNNQSIARGLNKQNPSVSSYRALRANAFAVRCCKD